MDKFLGLYKKLLWQAFESGEESVPVLRNSPDKPFRDASHQRRFIAACHRGYEKAQNKMVQLLQDIRNDSELTPGEQKIRELLVRKVADGIAMTILKHQDHVMRRLTLHDEAPHVSLAVINHALAEAVRLNDESRQTFALLADLTTFVHVADILRVDFRVRPVTYSLIELKSGRANKVIEQLLENYAPDQGSLNLIGKDSLIESRYKQQAKRILRQRIRLTQIDQILRTDVGTDPVNKLPIFLSQNEFKTESYHPLLNQLCESAICDGKASGSVNRCIHIGVGYDAFDKRLALQNAVGAVQYSIFRHVTNPPDGFLELFQETVARAPNANFLNTFNLLYSNLFAVPCRSLVLWGLDRDHLLSLVARKLCIVVCFDVISFIWLGRQVGLEISLSSRKEVTKAAQLLGSRNVPEWDGYGIKIKEKWGETYVLSGMLSRFINNLQPPLPFLESQKRADFGISIEE